MAKKKKRYTWFVEPLDSHTNSVISTGLDEGENLQRELICQDARHNAWQCPVEVIRFLWNSRIHLGLKFRIYNQSGNGTIRECSSLYKPKRKTKKTKKETKQ